MALNTAEAPDRSLGAIVRDLTTHFSTLFRSEVALLKLEIRQQLAKLGGGASMMTVALVLALLGVSFLFVTLLLGLVALGVPAWLSSLIVTVVLFGGAAAFFVMGRKKLADVNLVPSESVEQIRSDIDSIKADIARVRSR
jgi:uncharacterized membrane protein YqjE